MTEAEWLACTYPRLMLTFLRGKASDRNVRLFQVAAARLVWDRIPDGEMRDAVEAAEQYADGLVPAEKIDHYWRQFYQQARSRFATPQPPEWRRGSDKNTVFCLVQMTTERAELLRGAPGNSYWTGDIEAVDPDLPPLLRDIFGPLGFRPVTADPTAEVVLPGGVTLRVPLSADPAHLARLIVALRGATC